MAGMMGMMMPGMMGMGGGDSSERTVLEFAVSEQDAEMVTALLDAGVLPIEADKEPESPDTPATPPGMGLPGMMGGMPGMMNPYGMMGMGMPLPESPTAFELATEKILPLLLAKVPEALLPKALEEDGEADEEPADRSGHGVSMIQRGTRRAGHLEERRRSGPSGSRPADAAWEAGIEDQGPWRFRRRPGRERHSGAGCTWEAAQPGPVSPRGGRMSARQVPGP